MSLGETLSVIVGGLLDRLGIHYYVLRLYRVESQNADGTLELRLADGGVGDIGGPASPNLPGLSNVPIYQIGPGTSIKVPNNSYVLVGFLNGQPDKRYALSLWDGQNCTQLILKADDLQLGGQATEGAMLGTSFRNDLTAFHNALQVDLAATDAVVAAAATGAIDPSVKAAFVKLKVLLLTWQAQIAKLEGARANHVSTVVKVKK